MGEKKERAILHQMATCCAADESIVFHLFKEPFRLCRTESPDDAPCWRAHAVPSDTNQAAMSIEVRGLADLVDWSVRFAKHRASERWGNAPGNAERLRRPLSKVPKGSVSESAIQFKKQLDELKLTHGHLFTPSSRLPTPQPCILRTKSSESILLPIRQPSTEPSPSPSRDPVRHIPASISFDLQELDERLQNAEEQAQVNRGLESTYRPWRQNGCAREALDLQTPPEVTVTQDRAPAPEAIPLPSHPAAAAAV